MAPYSYQAPFPSSTSRCVCGVGMLPKVTSPSLIKGGAFGLHLSAVMLRTARKIDGALCAIVVYLTDSGSGMRIAILNDRC